MTTSSLSSLHPGAPTPGTPLCPVQPPAGGRFGAKTPTARQACLPSKTVHGQTTSAWHVLIEGSEDPEDTSPCGSPSLPSPARSSCTVGKGGTVPMGLGEAQPWQRMSPLQSHETSRRDVLNWPVRRGGEALSSPGSFSQSPGRPLTRYCGLQSSGW